MLVSFRVSNFRSIADEQELSFVATSDTSLPRNVETDEKVIGHDRFGLLRSLFLYGANASGKSNFCRAILAMKQLVIASATDLNKGDDMSYHEPFEFDENLKNKPCHFEATVLLDGVLFRYGYEANQKQIDKEWLFQRKSIKGSRETPVFTRNGQDSTMWEFHNAYSGPSKILKERTRSSNSLILSKAAQENIDSLAPLYLWFRDKLEVINMADVPREIVAGAIRFCSKGGSSEIGTIANVADASITDVTTSINEEEVDTSKEHFDNSRKPTMSVIRMQLQHNFGSNNAGALDLADESNGTIRFVGIGHAILEAFRYGKTLVFDELECSLHTILTQEIRDILNDEELGSSGAQFIVATHDTNILDIKKLRRDQIYLVDKLPDGTTECYSLADIDEKPRPDVSLERQYLLGRYGGTPVLGDLRATMMRALAISEESHNES